VLLVLPTGGGKGTMATFIIERACNKGKKVMFLVNRQLLVDDMSDRLDRLGIDHGIIMSDHPRRRPWLNVHIASIDTLHRRTTLPQADIIFLDEAHHAVSPIWSKVLDRYLGAAVIGMTATPCRLDGKGLGHLFQAMVVGPSVADLIEVNLHDRSSGVVPLRVYAPSAPDLTGVRTVAGDYHKADLVRACTTLTGDIVEHWTRLGRGRPTIGWAVDIPHSKRLTEDFRKAGIHAEHMDNTMPRAERRILLARLQRYEIEVIWSIGVLGYGVDCPAVACGISARPTKSLSLFLQQIGRLARALPDKEYSILLDHAGNTLQHGFFEDPRKWSLADGYIKPSSSSEDDGPSIRMCKQCFRAFPCTVDVCPECGWIYVAKGRKIVHVKGDLKEVAPARYWICQACDRKGRLADNQDYTTPCPACGVEGALKPLGSRYDNGEDESVRKEKYFRWFLEGKEKNYKPAWAAMRYNAVYGRWPAPAWKAEAERAAANAAAMVMV
jgi:superfamily II DNA or RNA helicase